MQSHVLHVIHPWDSRNNTQLKNLLNCKEGTINFGRSWVPFLCCQLQTGEGIGSTSTDSARENLTFSLSLLPLLWLPCSPLDPLCPPYSSAGHGRTQPPAANQMIFSCSLISCLRVWIKLEIIKGFSEFAWRRGLHVHVGYFASLFWTSLTKVINQAMWWLPITSWPTHFLSLPFLMNASHNYLSTKCAWGFVC